MIRFPDTCRFLSLLLTAVLLPGLLLAEAPARPATHASPTHERILDNGLKVIVREDHRSPMVVFQVWYKVGSSYEQNGKTGVSHLLEHMMFKGSQKVPPGEFSKIVARLGGQENAFTTSDYTGYYQIITRDKLPVSFELEADRMAGLRLPEDDFLKERDVVKEERRMRTEDKPEARAYERFLELAHTRSNYQQPVIGWMDDIGNLTVDDLRQWHRLWYAPDNAILVIAGDVQPDEVFQLAEHWFGDLEPGHAPPPPPVTDVPPLGERRTVMRLPVKVPSLMMAFNVPSLATVEDTREAYALEMLAGVLDGGYSARIETRLVRQQQVAAGASASYSPLSRGDTLFMLSGTPFEQHTLEELEAALLAEIDELKHTPPSLAEMQRVKAGIISGMVYQKDAIASQANEIGSLEAMGFPWQLGDEYIEHLKQVTPEDVQHVARKYLTRDRLAVAWLEPEA